MAQRKRITHQFMQAVGADPLVRLLVPVLLLLGVGWAGWQVFTGDWLEAGPAVLGVAFLLALAASEHVQKRVLGQPFNRRHALYVGLSWVYGACWLILIRLVGRSPLSGKASEQTYFALILLIAVGVLVHVYVQVPIPPVLIFIILFGVVLFVGTARFYLEGWVHSLLLEPRFHFKYWGFDWVPELPAWGMHAHFALLAVLSAMIALGAYYRVVVPLFLLAFGAWRLLLRELSRPDGRTPGSSLTASQTDAIGLGLFLWIGLTQLVVWMESPDLLAAVGRGGRGSADGPAGGAVGGERLLEFMDEFELDRLEPLARAFADFVDLKTPFTLGHSAEVAEIAAAAARSLGLEDPDAVLLAGLLHDLGRTGVSGGVWERPRSLSAAEWEQVRLHPYYTERILARSEVLAPIARIAGMHHERQDGSGYHHGASGAEVPVAAGADPRRSGTPAFVIEYICRENRIRSVRFGRPPPSRRHRSATTSCDAATGLISVGVMPRANS